MEDLREYLKECYPSADDTEIDHYLYIIENNDTERLPATKEMKELASVRKKAKELELEDVRLKTIVVEQRKRLGGSFQLFSIYSQTKRFWQPARFYDWVAGFVEPELLEQITQKTINEKEFIRLEAKGLIKYEEIPETCLLESNKEEWIVKGLTAGRKKKQQLLEEESEE